MRICPTYRSIPPALPTRPFTYTSRVGFAWPHTFSSRFLRRSSCPSPAWSTSCDEKLRSSRIWDTETFSACESSWPALEVIAIVAVSMRATSLDSGTVSRFKTRKKNDRFGGILLALAWFNAANHGRVLRATFIPIPQDLSSSKVSTVAATEQLHNHCLWRC